MSERAMSKSLASACRGLSRGFLVPLGNSLPILVPILYFTGATFSEFQILAIKRVHTKIVLIKGEKKRKENVYRLYLIQ